MSTAERAITASAEVYVDGRWESPRAGWIEDIDPTSGEVFGRAPNADLGQMERAVVAARRAADDGAWAADPQLRANCLKQLSDALFAHRGDVVDLARREYGVVDAVHTIQIDGPAFMASRGAEHALVPMEYEQETFGAEGRCLIRHEPMGVVSVITPWNFPHMINVMKLSAILAGGNTVVLKPSPLTPMIGLALARIIDQHTDIPDGVVNVVTTDSLTASELLTTHPGVDMVSFTGSSAVGRTIMTNGGSTMKRLLLECGGKSACILHGDIDVEAILPRLLFDCVTLHSGQACILNSRLLVPEHRRDEVIDRLAALAREVVLGDPRDPATRMGPLISAAHRDRVAGMVDRAVTAGATLVTGGRRRDGLTGFFYEPTILIDVDRSSEIAQEEVFGPVLSVLTYTDIDDAIAIANDSPYGLAGSVWSDDDDAATNIARRMRTGQVTVNGIGPGDAPYGGYKQSGFGRDGGIGGVRAYTETKAIGVPA
ncbi:aldehyde dehydrogenase family protein [Mycobacterium sp. NPDC051804]|uniref:aldehyde dehydrogenase family protein n=1 Tax=Mycobacterium sp. NPDC051804 TaxID=3364295 RepID=UPI00379A15A5